MVVFADAQTIRSDADVGYHSYPEYRQMNTGGCR